MREDESLSYRVRDMIVSNFESRVDPYMGYRWRWEVYAYPDEKVVVFHGGITECEKTNYGRLSNLLDWAVDKAVSDLGYGWHLKREYW